MKYLAVTLKKLTSKIEKKMATYNSPNTLIRWSAFTKKIKANDVIYKISDRHPDKWGRANGYSAYGIKRDHVISDIFVINTGLYCPDRKYETWCTYKESDWVNLP